MKSQIPYFTAAEERKSKSGLPEECCPNSTGNRTLLLHKYCFGLLTMMSSNTARLEWAPSFSICHEVKSVSLVLTEGLKWSMYNFSEDWYYQRMEVTFLPCELFWQRIERLSRWLLFGKVLPSSHHPHLALKCAMWESRWMSLLFVVPCFRWYVTAVVQNQSLVDPLFH